MTVETDDFAKQVARENYSSSRPTVYVDDDRAFHRTALATPVCTANLSDIVGIENDPSLQLAGVSVDDNVVRVKVVSATGIHVLHFAAEDARRVVTELIAWSTDYRGLGENV
ncbi:hypothetical protein H7K45_24940 [Mycobacterium yunnanensis]|uniref:Uncharacterized protein n=1 Tax=Mycobacterium yunnanensis TaxID=368477 RepID=A0A9X2Z8F3_9MYCO|nr:hypothetical protein [Mycobacterium yunnanensis]MCV7423806.1 hypothetical protein [Mycobacterium yunnanensis]